PLQSRTEAAAQAAAAQEADQQIDRRGRPGRDDADPAQAIFQRARTREAVAGGFQGEEDARQSREREETRLRDRERPPDVRARVATVIASQRVARMRAR